MRLHCRLSGSRHANAQYIFSVCTGALLSGAAGLLQGVRATTHWSAHHLLPYFGANPVDARVVVGDRHISAAGVTAGLDGALRLVSLVRNERLAHDIQLSIEYSPEHWRIATRDGQTDRSKTGSEISLTIRNAKSFAR